MHTIWATVLWPAALTQHMRDMEPQLWQHHWSKKQEKHRAIHPICTWAQGRAFRRSARCPGATASPCSFCSRGRGRVRAVFQPPPLLHSTSLPLKQGHCPAHSSPCWEELEVKITPPHYWKTPWHHCSKGARGMDHSRQKFMEGFGGSSESADEQLQLKNKFPQRGIPQMVPSRPKEIPLETEVWKYSSFMKRPPGNHKNTLKNVTIAAFAIKGELHSFVFLPLTTAYPTSKSAHCILGMSINKQFPVKHGKGRSFTAFSLKRAAASESLLQIQLCIFTCVLLPNPFSSSLHHNINSK